MLATACLWMLFGLSVGAFNMVRLRRYINIDDLPRIFTATVLDVSFQAVIITGLMFVFLVTLALLRRLARLVSNIWHNHP